MAKRTPEEIRTFVFGYVLVFCLAGTIVDRVDTDTTMTLTVANMTAENLIALSQACRAGFAIERYKGIQINFSLGSATTYGIEVIIPDQLLA